MSRNYAVGFLAALLSLASTASAQAPLPREATDGAFMDPFPLGIVLDVNPSGGSSNLNGILEPGEVILVQPLFFNPNLSFPLTLVTSASNFAGPTGAAYTIVDGIAGYQLPEGGAAFCSDCYVLSLDDPSPRPAAHWDASFDDSWSGLQQHVQTWVMHVGRSFSDVPPEYPFYYGVEDLFHYGVTAGCGTGLYCPSSPVTRAQIAVFLLKAEHGSAYVPPPCAGVFTDVACPSPFSDWIEALHAEGVSAGCGSGAYCPHESVRRRQMAVLLLRANQGASYVPPPAVGIFGDVPVDDPFAPWIEDLYNRNITAGCQATPLMFCPDSIVTRGQTGFFVGYTFHMSL